MNDLTRFASLIKLKDGVTQSEAVAALKTIKHLLEAEERYDFETKTYRPAKGNEVVRAYNPEHGSPTFYIP